MHINVLDFMLPPLALSVALAETRRRPIDGRGRSRSCPGASTRGAPTVRGLVCWPGCRPGEAISLAPSGTKPIQHSTAAERWVGWCYRRWAQGDGRWITLSRGGCALVTLA